MKPTITLLAALLLAPLSARGEPIAETSVLISNGKARGVIYLAPGATPTARYAAEELRDHLKLATGVELPITDALPDDPATSVVLVGPSAAAEARGVSAKGLGLEEHRLVSGANWLVLLGDDMTKGAGRLGQGIGAGGAPAGVGRELAGVAGRRHDQQTRHAFHVAQQLPRNHRA
jgi:hypothetical protein